MQENCDKAKILLEAKWIEFQEHAAELGFVKLESNQTVIYRHVNDYSSTHDIACRLTLKVD